MASKKPKTELVAICKLEFYRKQKSWKFCSQERKAKDSKRLTKSTNAKLNQTYNIAPAPKQPVASEPADPEEQQDLDEAFVESETGTASESEELLVEGQNIFKDLETETGKPSSQSERPWSPYSPRWSIQRWAEHHRLRNPEPTQNPPCPTFDPPCPAFDPPCPTHDCLTHDPIYPLQDQDIDSPIYPQQNFVQDTYCPIFDNNYNQIQQELYSNQYFQHYPYDSNYPTYTKHTEFNPKYASVFYYNSRYEEFYVPRGGQSETFVPRDDMMTEGKEWDDREWCAGEGAASSEPGWLAEAAALGVGGAGGACGPGGEDAADGPRRRHLGSVSRCDSLSSVGSGEFLRGAALAPHSTQIDLLLGPEPATALTGPALAAAVERYSAALRELLHEAHRRQQISSKEAPAIDEMPVRDPGPTQYHRPLCFNDPIVAGSFRNTPDLQGQTGQVGQALGEVGRGRGRGCGQGRVGVRAGRPCRL